MIAAEGLGKRFGDSWALRGVTLAAGPGEFLGVLGRNGAGKTTLVRLLTGHLKATEGTARVHGHDPAGLPLALRRVVGVMPEADALLDDLGGAQVLALVGQLHGLGLPAALARVRELQDTLEIDFHAARPIRDYSYGMRKKLAFACAVLHGPRLLFLDEPFEGLDPAVARTLLDCLARMREAGVTVVMTSHQLSLAERLCTRVLLLDAGRLVLDGPAAELIGPDEDLEGLFLRVLGKGSGPRRLSWM